MKATNFKKLRSERCSVHQTELVIHFANLSWSHAIDSTVTNHVVEFAVGFDMSLPPHRAQAWSTKTTTHFQSSTTATRSRKFRMANINL